MPLRRPGVAVAVAETSPLDGGTRIRTSCFRPIAAAVAAAVGCRLLASHRSPLRSCCRQERSARRVLAARDYLPRRRHAPIRCVAARIRVPEAAISPSIGPSIACTRRARSDRDSVGRPSPLRVDPRLISPSSPWRGHSGTKPANPLR